MRQSPTPEDYKKFFIQREEERRKRWGQKPLHPVGTWNAPTGEENPKEDLIKFQNDCFKLDNQ